MWGEATTVARQQGRTAPLLCIQETLYSSSKRVVGTSGRRDPHTELIRV